MESTGFFHGSIVAKVSLFWIERKNKIILVMSQHPGGSMPICHRPSVFFAEKNMFDVLSICFLANP